MRNLPRRFGHAATDRQFAYLSDPEIQSAQDANPLLGMSAQMAAEGLVGYDELLDLMHGIVERTRVAFDAAANEPKISSREEMIERTSQPMVAVPHITPEAIAAYKEAHPERIASEANQEDHANEEHHR